MTTSIGSYLPNRVITLDTQLEKQPRILNSGTEIRNYATRIEGCAGYIGSKKCIKLGDTRLRNLGVQNVEIVRINGKEPLVRFIGPKKGLLRENIGFLQKTENNQMKTFIKMLKDSAKHGVKPDFGLIANLLKHVK